MNAILTQSAGDQFMRYEAIRRRNAENAYDKSNQYNTRHQKTIENLEAMLKGTSDMEAAVTPKQEPAQLQAGQMKQISLPIGKTLEETVDLWRNVRAEAISEPEPTTADFQLAATASAKIREAEGQMGAEKKAQAELARGAMQSENQTADLAAFKLPSNSHEREMLLQKRFAKALSAYSIQVEAKKAGFAFLQPQFTQSA